MPEKEVKVISQAKMLKFIADTYTHEDEAFLEIEKMLNKGDIRIQNVHVLADIRKLAKTALELKNE